MVTPPTLTRNGAATDCLYSFANGSFLIRVVELGSEAAAQRSFNDHQHEVGGSVPVPNLGSAAFVRLDGTTITVKDKKILTVDPTRLPPGYDRTQIAESLSFEVLTCWTG